MFLQIHTLTSYHATLLNRDDVGLAKRIPFGDAPRLRVSSQCLKRHWRSALAQTLDLPRGVRSRQFFAREIFPRLAAADVPEDLARKLTRRLLEKLIDGGAEDGDSLTLKQAVLFGKPEADYLVALLEKCAAAGDDFAALGALDANFKAEKRNLKAMLRQAGYGDLFAGMEGALFGRFVTSDILARADAPVHVAHAFTVHALDTEVDYFTAVDELNRADEPGAAHAGDMELGAGLFYGYVAVDVPLLVSNFTGCDIRNWQSHDPSMARATLRQLIRAIATVSPGAKLGATAPYAYSEFVLLETGRQQPRSLANAYIQALEARGDIMQGAVDRLAKHLSSLDAMYGVTSKARAVSTNRVWDEPASELLSLNAAMDRILQTTFKRRYDGHPAPAV
jgi:CRISPR system Cascade subunit CasC